MKNTKSILEFTSDKYKLVIKPEAISLSPSDWREWGDLFSSCFGKDKTLAENVAQKYKSENVKAVFCFLLADGRIVANYSGFLLSVNNKIIFLATDTMSNGRVPNATEKMGRFIYDYLLRIGVDLVCGFPNEKGLYGQLRLGWKMTGKIYTYVGIPLLWRIIRRKLKKDQIWYLERPKSGFIVQSHPFLRVLGRHGLYLGSIFSFVFTLSAYKPGLFFIKVPEFLLKPKQFGGVALRGGREWGELFLSTCSSELDINCIDVP
jgi:hypothetical protein